MLCFSLMYESESDEKHLDFIAANAATVSICVIRSFCVAIRVQYSCPAPELSLPHPYVWVEPRGGRENSSTGPVVVLKAHTSLLQYLNDYFTLPRSLVKGIIRVAYDELPIWLVAPCHGKLKVKPLHKIIK